MKARPRLKPRDGGGIPPAPPPAGAPYQAQAGPGFRCRRSFALRYFKTEPGPASALRIFLGLLAASSLAALHPATCAAWGREGHQIVALVAERELAPETRLRIAALLAQDERKDLLAASTWADEALGKRPETAPWHYVNIPVSAAAYSASRDCPQGACVVAQLERLRGVLGSDAASPQERAEALKFLVHLVADVHQPLHAACTVLPQPRKRPRNSASPDAFCGGQPNSDRGGNGIKVRFGDEGISLHQVWDTELLYELRGPVEDVAERLDSGLTARQRREWAQGSPEDWANESHRLAQSVAYGMLPKSKRIVIPLRYETEARRTIELQLTRAGLRLARMLEDALGGPHPRVPLPLGGEEEKGDGGLTPALRTPPLPQGAEAR